jgi:hypothetical protein
VFTQGTSGAAGTLTLSGVGSAPLSLAVLGDYAADAFTATPVTVSSAGLQSAQSVSSLAGAGSIDTFVTVVPCFAAGTHIETAVGQAKVEDLHVGQEVRCLSRGAAPIVWIGRRRLDLRRHPTPDRFWPVRVRRDAFADGVPCRDLFLSPDHAVYVNGVLIPVRHLINGATINQVQVDGVTYYHIELARHDVLWAEALEVESFLNAADAGNMPMASRFIAASHRRPEWDWEAQGCARLVVTGRELDAVRERLERQRDSLVPDPARDLAERPWNHPVRHSTAIPSARV